MLINVATFDMIPMIDELNDFLWSFEFSTAANPRRALGWEALGFETKNFTANSGSLLMVAIIFVVWQLALRIIKALTPWSETLSLFYRRHRN